MAASMLYAIFYPIDKGMSVEPISKITAPGELNIGSKCSVPWKDGSKTVNYDGFIIHIGKSGQRKVMETVGDAAVKHVLSQYGLSLEEVVKNIIDEFSARMKTKASSDNKSKRKGKFDKSSAAGKATSTEKQSTPGMTTPSGDDKTPGRDANLITAAAKERQKFPERTTKADENNEILGGLGAQFDLPVSDTSESPPASGFVPTSESGSNAQVNSGAITNNSISTFTGLLFSDDDSYMPDSGIGTGQLDSGTNMYQEGHEDTSSVLRNCRKAVEGDINASGLSNNVCDHCYWKNKYYELQSHISSSQFASESQNSPQAASTSQATPLNLPVPGKKTVEFVKHLYAWCSAASGDNTLGLVDNSSDADNDLTTHVPPKRVRVSNPKSSSPKTSTPKSSVKKRGASGKNEQPQSVSPSSQTSTDPDSPGSSEDNGQSPGASEDTAQDDSDVIELSESAQACSSPAPQALNIVTAPPASPGPPKWSTTPSLGMIQLITSNPNLFVMEKCLANASSEAIGCKLKKRAGHKLLVKLLEVLFSVDELANSCSTGDKSNARSDGRPPLDDNRLSSAKLYVTHFCERNGLPAPDASSMKQATSYKCSAARKAIRKRMKATEN